MKFVNASETNPLVVEANPKNSDAFANTPIADGTGYIYVPAILYNRYK